jgi:PAS domain S-box-containing protein
MNSKRRVGVIVLDDNTARFSAYEAMLAPLEEQVIRAETVHQALQVLMQPNVAVILIDVAVKDSFAMVESIHRYREFQSTPVLFLSKEPLTNLDQLTGFEFGAVDYTMSPVAPETLRSKVRVLANRKRMQDSYKERADLLDLASEAIMVCDRAGIVQFWNAGAESLYGWKRDEMIGQNMHDVLETKFPVPFEQVEATILRVGRWEGNLLQRTKDGREVIVASRKALKVGSAAVDGEILEVNRDISAELEAHDALRRAEKWAAMGQVAGTIAHEVNNPLEAVTNALFLIKNQTLNEESQRYVRLIDDELARVSRITKQVLGFYRESQEPDLVSVTTLLDDVLEIQSSDLRRKGIRVERRYKDVSPILGFSSELRGLFLNLILNAIQAMPQGGRLRVSVQEAHARDQAGVRILICDGGPGVPADIASRIFEPFFTTKSGKGTGLGLWISRGIVQKHEGSISFRTLHTKNGSATCFKVFLPGRFSLAQNRDILPLEESA